MIIIANAVAGMNFRCHAIVMLIYQTRQCNIQNDSRIPNVLKMHKVAPLVLQSFLSVHASPVSHAQEGSDEEVVVHSLLSVQVSPLSHRQGASVAGQLFISVQSVISPFVHTQVLQP